MVVLLLVSCNFITVCRVIAATAIVSRDAL